jgi:hypothetical protein
MKSPHHCEAATKGRRPSVLRQKSARRFLETVKNASRRALARITKFSSRIALGSARNPNFQRISIVFPVSV